MKEVKGIFVVCIAFFAVLVLSACAESSRFLSEPMNAAQVSAVHITMAMGNPAYGADSKIITDREEIRELVELFNSAVVTAKVEDENLADAMSSTYIFLSGKEKVGHFVFNGDNTKVAIYKKVFHHIEYPDRSATPLELYQKSKAKNMAVDERGTPILKPLKAQ